VPGGGQPSLTIASRESGLREERMPKFDTPTREAASCERLKWGPQQRRVNLGPSDLKDAWRSIGSSRCFARRNSKVQKATLLCSDA
jgi:hypothetical protein